MIIPSEELAKNTQHTLDIIFKFLELTPEKINDLKKINVAKYPPMSKSIRIKLLKYFKEYNEKLYQLINQKFEWDK